jgi:predicted Zn-dependent protease
MKSKKLIFAGSLTAAALLLATLPFNMGGCGVGGVDVGNAIGGITTLGKSASLDKKEPEIGESVALQVTNRYQLYQDKNLTRYVTLVGRTVGAGSSNPALKYYFGILDSPQANAF